MAPRSISFVVFTALLVSTTPAFAHIGDLGGGFVSGFAHPLFGLDHLAAMVAVGLWGAFLGRPAIFVLPIVFPLVMAAGGILGIAGVPLVGTELFIAISAILLGLAVALVARPPTWVAASMVGVFAVFHGHAHGAELPAGADMAGYFAGFVIGTGLLHLVGIGIGLFAGHPGGRMAVRTAGALIAAAGIVFLGRLA